MIPFNLEKFKAGAVAVDEDGNSCTFISERAGMMTVKFMEKNGNLVMPLNYKVKSAEANWHMKESKWIVYREFESEEDALALEIFLKAQFEGDWKIKEV